MRVNVRQMVTAAAHAQISSAFGSCPSFRDEFFAWTCRHHDDRGGLGQGPPSPTSTVQGVQGAFLMCFQTSGSGVIAATLVVQLAPAALTFFVS